MTVLYVDCDTRGAKLNKKEERKEKQILILQNKKPVIPFGIFQYQISQIWYFLNGLVFKIWQI